MPTIGAGPAHTRSSPWLWLVILGGAALLFTARIDHEPLWLDEVYSFAMTRHSPVELVKHVAADVHPPLYYLALKLSVQIFGTTPAGLRALSVLGALACIGLAADPVRRIWGARAAYVFALVLLGSPGVLCFAQEARMYTLVMSAVTAAVLYGYLALSERRTFDVCAYGLCTLLAAGTHYFGLIAAAVNTVLLLGIASVRARVSVRPLLVAAALAAAAYLPWAPSAYAQVAAVAKGFWIPNPSFNLLVFGLVAPFTYKFEDIPYPPQALCALLLVVLVIGFGTVTLRRRSARRELSALLLLVLVYGGTLFSALLVSHLMRPIYMPRYMMSCAGLLLCATAVGLAALPHASWTALASAVVVIVNLPTSWAIVSQKFNGPFDELAASVNQRHETEPVLLHTDVQTLYPSWYALPHARHVLLFPREAEVWSPGAGVHASSRLEASRDLPAVLGQRRAVWLVDMTNAGYRVPDAEIGAQPGWRRALPPNSLQLPYSWVNVQLSYYEREAPDPAPGPAVRPPLPAP